MKNYFTEALQNENFRNWLKDTTVKSVTEREKNGGSSYYDYFLDLLESCDETPYSFITQEEWTKAIENDYDDDNELFDAHSDEIINEYADVLMSCYCDNSEIYDGLTIEETAKTLSGELFTIHPLTAIFNTEDAKSELDGFTAEVEENLREALKKSA